MFIGYVGIANIGESMRRTRATSGFRRQRTMGWGTVLDFIRNLILVPADISDEQ